MLWLEVGSKTDLVPCCCVQMLRPVKVAVGDLVEKGVTERVGISHSFKNCPGLFIVTMVLLCETFGNSI